MVQLSASRILMLLLVGSLLVCNFAQSQKKKAKNLMKLRNEKHIVELTDSNYDTYVTKSSTYNIVVLFTGRDSKYQCPVCERMGVSFEDIAASHYALSGADDDSLFFAICDVDTCKQPFRIQQFQTIPHIAAVRSGVAYNKSPYNNRLPDDIFSMGNSAKSVLDVIHDTLGVEIRFVGNTQMKLMYGAAAALVVAVLAGTLRRGPQFYLHRYLWRGVSLTVFFVCTSGFVYCLIKSIPLDRLGRDGSVINPNGREQWLLEGVAIAAIYAGITSCLVALVKLGQRSKGAPPPGLLRSFGRALVASLVLAVFCLLMCKYYQLYQGKTQWYSLTGTLPQGVKRWLSSKVTRTSSWPRRLLRLAEVFLVEFKSWPAFYAKSLKLLRLA